MGIKNMAGGIKAPVYVYISNHNSVDGISDHIELLRAALNFDFDIFESKTFEINQINIVIEEFSNPNTLKIIRKTKNDFPDTKFILYMTELPELGEGGDVLLNPHIAVQRNFLIELMASVVLFLKYEQFIPGKFEKSNSHRGVFYYFKYSFIKPLRHLLLLYRRLAHWLVRIAKEVNNSRTRRYGFYSFGRSFIKPLRHLLLLYRKPAHWLARFKEKLKASQFYKRSIKTMMVYYHDIYYFEYMCLRGKGLQEAFKHFDGVVDVHPKINDKIRQIFKCVSYTIYPKINLNTSKFSYSIGDPVFVCTGAVTGYRLDTVTSLNAKYPDFTCDFVGFISDSDLHGLKRYNLNIPQTSTWPMSSPVRVSRSLQAGLVPVFFKHYDDHPIEKCSFLLEDCFDENNGFVPPDLASLESSVHAYNQLAEQSFLEFTRVLKNL